MKPLIPEVGFSDRLYGAEQDLHCVAGAFVCNSADRFIVTSAFALARARERLVFARLAAIGEVVDVELGGRRPAHAAIGLIKLAPATQIYPELPWGETAPTAGADPRALLGQSVRVFGKAVAGGKVIATQSVCRVKTAANQITTFLDTVEVHFGPDASVQSGDLVLTQEGVAAGLLIANSGGTHLVAPLHTFLESHNLRFVSFQSMGWWDLGDQLSEQRGLLDAEPKLDLGPAPRLRKVG